jgi:outer membrane protein assembly factor BamB
VVSAPLTLVGRCLATGEADGTLRCRDPSDGSPRWAFASASALRAPPRADAAGHLVLGTTDRRIVSLDPRNGRVRWRFKVGADVEAPALGQGGRVFVAAFDAVLYALQAGNGNMAWRAALPSRPLSGPYPTHDALVVACHENEIVGFDPRTGRRLGGLKTQDLLRTAPLYAGRRLYVGLRSRAVQAFALPAPALPEVEPAPDSTSEAGR